MLSIKLLFTAISRFTFSLLLGSGALLSQAQAQSDIDLSAHLPTIENPITHQQLQISVKQTMAIGCNPHHRMASWVAFHLTEQDLDRQPRFKRITSNYPSDPLMNGPCVVTNKEFKDYTAAGYDRGHLADAESFSGTAEGNIEVAYTSNLTPQDLSFNRGIWAKLEAWQRSQALNEKEIFVYVGPVLNPNLPHLKAGISIPNQFYKIIIDLTPPQKTIAFLIDQTDRGSFKDHWVCPAQIEELTGLKFAENLLGADKEKLFSHCQLNQWQ